MHCDAKIKELIRFGSSIGLQARRISFGTDICIPLKSRRINKIHVSLGNTIQENSITARGGVQLHPDALVRMGIRLGGIEVIRVWYHPRAGLERC